MHKFIIVMMLIFVNCIGVAFAKELQLYSTPNADAKVVGKVDLAVGIMPIFTPDKSEWVKVADPRDGTVGWIKSTDLEKSGVALSSFTIKSADNVSAESRYKIIQFGQTKKMDDDKAQAMIEKLQQQQVAFQKSVSTMMADMQNLFTEQWKVMRNNMVPIVLPNKKYKAEETEKNNDKVSK